MQPVPERPIVSQPIQSPSPKFKITERHIPNKPWNDHANYFAALEDDDDETVAASNVSKGYFGKDDICMKTGPPTTAVCFTENEKPEQVNNMVTPVFLPNTQWAKCAWNSIVTQQELIKRKHYFQHHATETRSGVRHIGL